MNKEIYKKRIENKKKEIELLKEKRKRIKEDLKAISKEINYRKNSLWMTFKKIL